MLDISFVKEDYDQGYSANTGMMIRSEYRISVELGWLESRKVDT